MTTAQLACGFIIVINKCTECYMSPEEEKDAGVIMELAFKGTMEVQVS